MINSIYHKTVIPTGQLKSNQALAALLKGQTYNADGYEAIIGLYDTMRFLDYREKQLVAYIPTTNRLIIDLNDLSSNQGLISKYNKILKKFNLSCGLKEGKPWVKQQTGIAHSYSFYDGILIIDLKRTKECTRQSLWFMTYC